MANEPEVQRQILIRFRGICAHLDLSNGANGDGTKNGNHKKKKRTVLMRHRNGNSGVEHHIPYIEFYADDVESFSPELTLMQYSRPNTDGTFARVDLPVAEGFATLIRLKGAPVGEVEQEPNYKRDVPHFSEILRELSKKKKNVGKVAQTLLVEDPTKIDRSRTVAVFDMPNGRLLAGEPEAMITRFAPEVGFKERRLARWSDLHIPYPEDEKFVVELVSLSAGNAETRQIVFKDTIRMITIGNEPERLILGLIGQGVQSGHGINHASSNDPAASPTQPTGHFVLYYDLLENPPAPDAQPLPIPTQLTGSGCPNNNAP